MPQATTTSPSGSWHRHPLLQWSLGGGGVGNCVGALWTLIDAAGRPPINMLPVSIALYGSVVAAGGLVLGALIGLVWLPLRRAWVRRHGSSSTDLLGATV